LTPTPSTLLTLFSTQASIALQNAHLYALERRKASQLKAINAIAQQMTAVLDLNELLNKVCFLVQDAFHASHVSVLLKEEDEFVLKAHYGNLTPCVPDGGTHSRSGKLSGGALCAWEKP
jgi:hypothetical protein